MLARRALAPALRAAATAAPARCFFAGYRPKRGKPKRGGHKTDRADSTFNQKMVLPELRLKTQEVDDRAPVQLAWPSKIANAMTCARLVAAPGVPVLIAAGQPTAALGLFAWLALTDFLDGILARRLRATSRWGSVFDEVADKCLVYPTLLTLGTATEASTTLAQPAVCAAAALLLWREFLVGGARQYASLSIAVAVHVKYAGKLKAASQMAALVALLLSNCEEDSEVVRAAVSLRNSNEDNSYEKSWSTVQSELRWAAGCCLIGSAGLGLYSGGGYLLGSRAFI